MDDVCIDVYMNISLAISMIHNYMINRFFELDYV